MNTIWSDYIQGTQTLYLSRKLRFHDHFRDRYLPLFKLDPSYPLQILEIGCGPGALAQALNRWYPNASITGIDRDSSFISFAAKQVPSVTFLEGDIARLPFSDAYFDVVISHTVAEHVEPKLFYSEQRRVLKRGGVCLVLTSRKTLSRTAPCLSLSDAEITFWEQAAAKDDSFERYNIGKYWVSEDIMAKVMESFGFQNITTGYTCIDLTPDSSDTPDSLGVEIICANRDSELENLHSHQKHAAFPFSSDEYAAMEGAIQSRYKKRLTLFRSREKQWDTEVATIMVLRGIK